MPFATAASDWSIVHSPNNVSTQALDNFPSGVTCVSAFDCWAVGSYFNADDSGYQTLIQRWDGNSWSIVSSPNTSPTENNRLFGVACISASDCWAVGYGFNTDGFPQTLIVRWDGTSWLSVESPNTSATLRNVLSAVNCMSASNCWAVGYSVNNADVVETLIERWDGTGWAIVDSPNTSATQDNYLFSVTCVPAAADCWAVGHYLNDATGSYQALIEHWDGDLWTIGLAPSPSITQSSGLFGVTCVSTSDCWAVGQSFNDISGVYQALIEHWDGISWTIVISSNSDFTQANGLFAITCGSASDCWAVGHYFNTEGVAQTLIERWDGNSWAIVSSPGTGTSQPNGLVAVTCVPAAADCWVVGYYYNAEDIAQTLIERWDGAAWAIVDSPNATATQSNFLSGVACVTASDCWAVGYHAPGTFQNLIEHWDGTSWVVVNSPNTSATQANFLYGVACLSASNCWAVGSYYNGSAQQTLIEHWDGTGWAIVTSPNASLGQDNLLLGATCASTSDCWAVGQYFNEGVWHTLIEHWDGTAWVIVDSADAGAATYNVLLGVTCASPSECWAVGYHYGGGNVAQTLVKHWNGTAWAIVSSPNASAMQYNALSSVTCVSASDCWAVGYYGGGSAGQTLIERWDGAAWAIVSSPNTSATRDNILYGVTCASPFQCYAVGYTVADSAGQTLIQRWDGTAWEAISSPNTSATKDNILSGVTCVSASNCYAVGYAVGYYGTSQTLVLRYVPSMPPTPTSVVSRKNHGAAGSFDVDLPLTGNSGIDCRRGGTNNDYQIVVSFADAVTLTSGAVTSGSGTVASITGSGTTEVTVNLTAIANAQTITLTLSGVNDGTSSGDVAVRMAVLIGDTSADRFVNSSDISQTKSQSGQQITASNFRQDVTASGAINSSDISLVKSKSGTALP